MSTAPEEEAGSTGTGAKPADAPAGQSGSVPSGAANTVEPGTPPLAAAQQGPGPAETPTARKPPDVPPSVPPGNLVPGPTSAPQPISQIHRLVRKRRKALARLGPDYQFHLHTAKKVESATEPPVALGVPVTVEDVPAAVDAPEPPPTDVLAAAVNAPVADEPPLTDELAAAVDLSMTGEPPPTTDNPPPTDDSVPPRGIQPDIWGLALSGGGIRSATFCFGFLRTIADEKSLLRFDLLSTVSGGGYIGATVGALFHRATQPEQAKVVEERIGAGNSRGFLWWLRANGRYLIPRGPKDTMYAAALFLRNLSGISGAIHAP